MSLLEVKNVTMQFGGLTAVSNFNLQLNKGEIVGLIGPNGAGKTTSFNVITGEYIPTKGQIIMRVPENAKDKIVYKDIDITKSRPDQVTKLGIARTFQNIRLFKDLSVLENVLIAN